MRARFISRQKDLPTVLLTGRVRRVWREYGNNITYGLEKATNLQFINGVTVCVGYNTESDTLWSGSSGYANKKSITILLPGNTRLTRDDLILWLLIHELGHRLLDQYNIHSIPTPDKERWHEEEHKILFSFLVEAMNYAFGDSRAAFIIQRYPNQGYTDTGKGHTRAWRWATSISSVDRAAIWNNYRGYYC